MSSSVSPGLKAGSGLKHEIDRQLGFSSLVSPGLKAGSGLKHRKPHTHDGVSYVSPGLKAGSGLKPADEQMQRFAVWYLPA